MSDEIAITKFCRAGGDRYPREHVRAVQTKDGVLRFASKHAYRNYEIATSGEFASDSDLTLKSLLRLHDDTRAFRAGRKHKRLSAAGNAHCYKAEWLRQYAVTFSGDECLYFPSMVAHRPEQVKYNYKQMAASRAVLLMTQGLPPKPRMQATHKCGCGHLSCVNPDHLAWQTPQQNAKDRFTHQSEAVAIDGVTARDAAMIRSMTGLCRVVSWETSIPAAIIDKIRSGDLFGDENHPAQK